MIDITISEYNAGVLITKHSVTNIVQNYIQSADKDRNVQVLPTASSYVTGTYTHRNKHEGLGTKILMKEQLTHHIALTCTGL